MIGKFLEKNHGWRVSFKDYYVKIEFVNLLWKKYQISTIVICIRKYCSFITKNTSTICSNMNWLKICLSEIKRYRATRFCLHEGVGNSIPLSVGNHASYGDFLLCMSVSDHFTCRTTSKPRIIKMVENLRRGWK